MAIAPLNEFKSRCFDLTENFQTIIAVPVSVATIILDARAINITGIEPYPIAFNSYLTVKLIKSESNEALIVPEMEIPPNDSLGFISGKFVMQEGDIISARADGDGRLQLVISYLETSA